jgi:dienelactone hydrolase
VRTALRAARIGGLSLILKEPSSTEDATGHSPTGAPVRILPVDVRFPVPAADVARRVMGEPFPLVVFSQGFDESIKAYTGLISAWVRAGYVVATPIYPFTDPSSPVGVDENDIVNHPADLRYIIAALQRLSLVPNSRLHGVLDPRRVAIAGQSDGGDVSLAVAANSCCRSSSVRAAMILSGAELAAFGGGYYTNGSVPLLVTQGTEDPINPPECSAQLYDGAPQPKYYLSIAGAGHLPPYVSPGPIRSGIIRLTTAFLNAYLKHGPTGAQALSSAARLPSQETLTGAPTAPGSTSTYCPGAP